MYTLTTAGDTRYHTPYTRFFDMYNLCIPDEEMYNLCIPTLFALVEIRTLENQSRERDILCHLRYCCSHKYAPSRWEKQHRRKEEYNRSRHTLQKRTRGKTGATRTLGAAVILLFGAAVLPLL